jgi:hypothetical protein
VSTKHRHVPNLLSEALDTRLLCVGIPRSRRPVLECLASPHCEEYDDPRSIWQSGFTRERMVSIMKDFLCTWCPGIWLH